MWFRVKFRSPSETIPRWEPRGEEVKTYTESSHGKNMRVSDLEELFDLSDDDYLLVIDTSAKRSVKVKLSTMKAFIKS